MANNKSKHVYALLTVDGSIKIGISKQPEKRFSQIENASGKRIIKQFVTKSTPNAKKIENLIFQKFSLYRKRGEWFDGIDYDDVLLHMKFYDYEDEENVY